MTASIAGVARVRVAILVALCAFAVSATSMPQAAVAGIHVQSNRVTLHLPKRGHKLVSRNTTRIPRRLRGILSYVQLIGADGKYSAKARVRQPLVFADPTGKKLFSLTLTLSYQRKTGALRLALALKNIGVRNYKSKAAVVRARVTICWKR
jgi:hypothetical protein